MNKRIVLASAAAAAGMLGAAGAGAQEYPERLVRFVVAYPAGATDTAARTVTNHLGELWKKPVIVDNKPGAGSGIGADFVQRAAPDGYTLFWSTDSTHTLNPHLYKSLMYEPLGFAPVIKTVTTVNVLAVNATAPYRTLAELLAYAKANPAKASYGSAGVGISNHLAGELLQHVTGIPLVHVPYKGSGPATADLMAGNLAFMFAGAGHIVPYARSGKFRVLGVTDTVRHKSFPDVPTMDEAGVKGFDLPNIYHAVLAPPKTPATIVNRINQSIRTSLADRDTAAKLDSQGYDVTPTSPEELGALLKRNYEIWGRIVGAAKIEKM